MPQRPPLSSKHPGPRPQRDFELCKVVFAAAISQILYARRAFPPECFQLLPLGDVVSQSLEDILATEDSIQVHDKELLRELGKTIFLRRGMDYGVNRFLGILREDIFPLIETEGLIRFRINFLRNKTWRDNCLLEYYTVALKYEPEGRYGLDIWRAGTGRQHIAMTDSQLWNLGDYLSRLPSSTEPLHWTLAFHATERPDDPPIGVWKFDRTEFDDANFDLQQRDGYTYSRIVRLEIMPLSPADIDKVIPETSPDRESETIAHQESQAKPSGKASGNQTQKKQTRARKPNAKDRGKGRRGPTAAQLSPPLTSGSSRNTSKAATAENTDQPRAADHMVTGVANGADGPRNPASRKGLVTKRKPKRPLQLFEIAASSLPPTQSIGESQSLTQMTQAQKNGRDDEVGNDLTGFINDMFRSPSPDTAKLLDGVSLSPEAIPLTQHTPHIALPRPSLQLPSTQRQQRHETPTDAARGILRLRPSSSVAGAPPGSRQWEPRASPPANLIGITVSDDEENIETASEAEPETPPRLQTDQDGDTGNYHFSPNTVARRTSLFHGLPDSSDEEEG